MKKIMMVMMAMVLFTPAVYAEEAHIDHYEGKEFKNADAAMDALIETSEKMAILAADENLDVAKMEQIHETSYTTEDAVALLEKEKKIDTKELAEKLEEVHLASEDHEAEKLRRNFIAYQAELNEYLVKLN